MTVRPEELACGPRLKRCYRSPAEALHAAQIALTRSGVELRVYRCPGCGWLHLTKTDRERQRQAQAAAVTPPMGSRKDLLRRRGQRHRRHRDRRPRPDRHPQEDDDDDPLVVGDGVRDGGPGGLRVGRDAGR